MNIVVISGNQVAMSGTVKEVEEALQKLQVVLIEKTDVVTKYKIQQDTHIKVAK